MGYTTEFDGSVSISPPLNPHEKPCIMPEQLLRMNRDRVFRPAAAP